jgi:hypothetical protein
MMRIVLAAALVLCTWSEVRAQRPAPEVRFRIGGSWFLDEDLPTHLTVGGSLRAYLTKRLSVEPEYLHIRRSSERYSVALGNIAYDLADPAGRAVPYAMGGVGLFHSRTTLPGGGFSSNDLTFLGGIGTKVHVNRRVFFFPELRIGIEPNIYLTVTGGLGFTLR